MLQSLDAGVAYRHLDQQQKLSWRVCGSSDKQLLALGADVPDPGRTPGHKRGVSRFEIVYNKICFLC